MMNGEGTRVARYILEFISGPAYRELAAKALWYRVVYAAWHNDYLQRTPVKMVPQYVFDKLFGGLGPCDV